jgi:hypothetical protein
LTSALVSRAAEPLGFCSPKGTASWGTLGHSRDKTFHYPYPGSAYQIDEHLTRALRALGPNEVTLVSEGGGFVRLHFADYVALALAFGKYDPSRLREQTRIAVEGARSFVNFATRAWEAYCVERELGIGMPDPPTRGR